jgi:hypothetical protein
LAAGESRARRRDPDGQLKMTGLAGAVAQSAAHAVGLAFDLNQCRENTLAYFAHVAKGGCYARAKVDRGQVSGI